MAQGILKRKLDRGFELLDTDGDGAIERSDFDTMVDYMIGQFGISNQAPKAVNLRNAVQELWDAIHRDLDKNRDAKIDRHEFERAMDSGQGTDVLRQAALPYARAVADLADQDGDGRITFEEFQKIMSPDIPSADQRASFEALDVDGDGTVTKEELVQGVQGFFGSQDPNARGNLLGGRI